MHEVGLIVLIWSLIYRAHPMARVLIAVAVAFLVQLAGGQDEACMEALNTLQVNSVRCTATTNNPRVMCTGQCGTYFENIIDSCSPEVKN